MYELTLATQSVLKIAQICIQTVFEQFGKEKITVQFIPIAGEEQNKNSSNNNKRKRENGAMEENYAVGLIRMKIIQNEEEKKKNSIRRFEESLQEILKVGSHAGRMITILTKDKQLLMNGSDSAIGQDKILELFRATSLVNENQVYLDLLVCEDHDLMVHLVLLGQSFLETMDLIRKELLTLGMFSSYFTFENHFNQEELHGVNSSSWTSEKLTVTSLQPEIVKTHLSAFIHVEYASPSTVQPLHDKENNKNRIQLLTSLSKNGEILCQDARQEMIMGRVKGKNRTCELSISSEPNTISFNETAWERKSLSFPQKMSTLALPESNNLSNFGLQISIDSFDESCLIIELPKVRSINSSLRSIYIAFNIETTCKTKCKLIKAMFQSLSLALLECAKLHLPHSFFNKNEKRQSVMTQYYIPLVADSISGIVQHSQNHAFKGDCLKLLQIDSLDEISSKIQQLLLAKTNSSVQQQ